MLPRLSIVIPVSHGIERLEDTLVSVLENRPDACEVIVVHGGCYTDPYDLSDEVRFVESAGRGGLVDLANLGMEAARGDLIHLIACGTLVEEGWTEPALAHFRDPQVASVTPLVLDDADPPRITAAGVASGWGGRRALPGRGRAESSRYRPSNRIAGPTLAAAFFRREALAHAGGLARAVGDRFADLDAALTLRLLGYTTVFEPASRLRGSAAMVTPPAGSLASGWTAERFFWRSSSERSWLEILVGHPLLVSAELVADIVRLRWPRLPGRLAACCCALVDVRHQRRLRDTESPTIPFPGEGPAGELPPPADRPLDENHTRHPDFLQSSVRAESKPPRRKAG